VELIAAGTEQLAAGGIGAGADFQDGASGVSVVFDGKAVEDRFAGGAGGGGELRSHKVSMLSKAALVKHKIVEVKNTCTALV
jgi:hypothetical protein